MKSTHFRNTRHETEKRVERIIQCRQATLLRLGEEKEREEEEEACL